MENKLWKKIFCEKYKKKTHITLHSAPERSIRTFSKILSRKLESRETKTNHLTTIPFRSSIKKKKKKNTIDRLKLRFKRINPIFTRVKIFRSKFIPCSWWMGIATEQIESRVANRDCPAGFQTKPQLRFTPELSAPLTMLTYRCGGHAGYANGIRGHFGADNHGG